ncbi:MAG: CaiB/BaiF CoA-transferase family protein, partial [Alphaproteobacteria bacterium]|nr:CaiB/BaiF CoA-transferase family protein [Alphaproteobacteria bacterium]
MPKNKEQTGRDLPLFGIKVIEISHMVMGPTVGLILADMGAEVIKVEPLGGDKTRRLKGSGAGYFPMYNRNKKSIAIDLKTPQGQALIHKLIMGADILIENFRTGMMEKLGLGYDALAAKHKGLIYCSEKGFLAGPYENRTALDEMAQMMSGLAYMTGPPGRPLRAGASVVDVLGGVFGATAILAALAERTRTGRGQYVKSALYESAVFLVGQHIAQYAVTATPAPPMPVRISAWAVYDIFDTADSQIFIGVVSDSQWQIFCDIFDFPQWADEPTLATNNMRVAKREEILPPIRDMFAKQTAAEIIAKLEAAGLPFAPVRKPEELADDPHLLQSNGLLDLHLPDNAQAVKLPALPIEMQNRRFACHTAIPAIGAHTLTVLQEAGLSKQEIAELHAQAIIEGEN